MLALAVLVAAISMLAGLQHLQARRNLELRGAREEAELRAALLLGLREACGRLANGERFGTLEFEASNGAGLRIAMRDAQDRFNVNHLIPEPAPGVLRDAWDVFEDLMRRTGQPLDPGTLRAARREVTEREIPFTSPEELSEPGEETSLRVEDASGLVALPHPAGRWLPLNLNTVRPEVLRATVGDPLSGWADSVLAAREREPLQSVTGLTAGFPPEVAAWLGRVFTVESLYWELTLQAEYGTAYRRLTALVIRDPAGEVEVLQCRW